jgi:spore coat-associated protein N
MRPGWSPRVRRLRGRARLLVGGIGLLVGGLGLIVRGAFAGFTDSTNGSHADTSGNLTLTLPAPGSTNRISVAYPNIRPGDTVQRAFDLTYGSVYPANVSVTTSASTSSLLDTDATNGLKLTLDRCSGSTQPGGGWLEAGSSPNYTYTCPSGTIASVLAQRSIIGSKVVLSNLNLAANGTDHLRLQVNLPTTSPTTMQGLTSTILYLFEADQRAGGAQ